MSKRQKILKIKQLNLSARNDIVVIEPDYIRKRYNSNFAASHGKHLKISKSSIITKRLFHDNYLHHMADSGTVVLYIKRSQLKD